MGVVSTFYTRTAEAARDNSTTELLMLYVDDDYTGDGTVPADAADVGDMIRITCTGQVSSTGAQNVAFTFTLNVYFPDDAAPIATISKGFPAAFDGHCTFQLTFLITYRRLTDDPNSGRIASNGICCFTNNGNQVDIRSDGPNVTDIDTDEDNTVDIGAAVSVLNASIGFSMDQCVVEWVPNGYPDDDSSSSSSA